MQKKQNQRKQNQRKQKSKFSNEKCVCGKRTLCEHFVLFVPKKKQKNKTKNGKQKAKSNFSANRNTNSVRFVLFRCFSFSVRKVKQKINCFCKPIFYHFCGFVKQQK